MYYTTLVIITQKSKTKSFIRGPLQTPTKQNSTKLTKQDLLQRDCTIRQQLVPKQWDAREKHVGKIQFYFSKNCLILTILLIRWINISKFTEMRSGKSKPSVLGI